MSKRLNKKVDEFLTGVRKLEDDLLCAQHGWKAWPENATEAEQKAAFDALLNGGEYTLYPPGYITEPVDESGKLQAEPCQEEQKHWWEVWK